MFGKSPVLLLACGLAALMSIAQPALADRIDGNWCYKARTMSVDGPNIVTPGGTRMAGLYHRHGFKYTVPAGETDAGAVVEMIQLDDYTIQATTAPPGGAARTEIWKRCDLTT